MRNAPGIVDLDSRQLEEVLRRVEQLLDEQDSALIRAVFRSYIYVSDLVEDRNTSIRQLRQLFFGSRTEKTDAVVGREPQPPAVIPQSDGPAGTASGVGEPSPALPDPMVPGVGLPEPADNVPAAAGHRRPSKARRLGDAVFATCSALLV